MRTLSNFSINAPRPWGFRNQEWPDPNHSCAYFSHGLYAQTLNQLKSHLLGWHPFSGSPLPVPQGAVGCKGWPCSCSVWAQCPPAAFNHKPAMPPHRHLWLSFPRHCCTTAMPTTLDLPASYLPANPRAQRMERGNRLLHYIPFSLPSTLQRKGGQQINSKGWWGREAYQSTLSLSDLPWNPTRDCQKLVPVLKSLQWPFRKRTELRSQLHHKVPAFCKLNSRRKQMFPPAALANPITWVRQHQHTVQF